MAKDKYVRFDWAAKRMLRNKANFGVLEGLITVLTSQKMQIVEAIGIESAQHGEAERGLSHKEVSPTSADT